SGVLLVAFRSPVPNHIASSAASNCQSLLSSHTRGSHRCHCALDLVHLSRVRLVRVPSPFNIIKQHYHRHHHHRRQHQARTKPIQQSQATPHTTQSQQHRPTGIVVGAI